MDNKDYTTEQRKGEHLSSEERHEIEVRLKDQWTICKIARHLKRPYTTIKNEIARGTVLLYPNCNLLLLFGKRKSPSILIP